MSNEARTVDLKRLGDKFKPEDIEWRIGRAGKKSDGSVWALALAYVTNRAIQERLDEVCGPENWQNVYTKAPDGGVLCGIAIRISGDDWVTKWDGAENTRQEAVKGGLSGAMKRAGVQWGIGRYLYKLPETFVKTGSKGEYANRGTLKAKGGGTVYYTWQTPRLPPWALPEGVTQQEDEHPQMDYDEPDEEQVATITEEQIITITEILESKGWNVNGTLQRLAEIHGASSITELPATKYREAHKAVADLPKNEGGANGSA